MWVEKKNYGKTYMGVQRSAFLIGDDGKVEKAWPKISPKDTPTNLLAATRVVGARRQLLTACVLRSSRSTNSSAETCVLSSTTGQAKPASNASAQRAAHTHHWSPSLQAGEAVLRHRRRQVVAGLLRELEELVGDPATHDVHAGVVAMVLAATRAVVAGHRIERARLELGAEHVDLAHDLA